MAIIRALASGSRSALRAQNINATTLTQAAMKAAAFKGKNTTYISKSGHINNLFFSL